MKHLKTAAALFAAAAASLTPAMTAFAESDGIRYPLSPTITPLRIFFAVLAVILFVAAEIVFEKVREKKVEERNKSYERKDKE